MLTRKINFLLYCNMYKHIYMKKGGRKQNKINFPITPNIFCSPLIRCFFRFHLSVIENFFFRFKLSILFRFSLMMMMMFFCSTARYQPPNSANHPTLPSSTQHTTHQFFVDVNIFSFYRGEAFYDNGYKFFVVFLCAANTFQCWYILCIHPFFVFNTP